MLKHTLKETERPVYIDLVALILVTQTSEVSIKRMMKLLESPRRKELAFKWWESLGMFYELVVEWWRISECSMSWLSSGGGSQNVR